MIKLVVDATCELSVEEAKQMGVVLIPMKISFEDKDYLAGLNLTMEEFYSKLASSKNLPHTTQINADDYISVIKPLLDAGDDVFVMSISHGLSGCFNSLRLASEELNTPHLEIFDTETFTIAYQALVEQAVKFIKEGVTLSELKEKMNNLKPRVKLLAIIDNVKYLVKGGRLSRLKGMLVSALKIKPIISIIHNRLEVIGKAIGFESAKKALMKLIGKVDKSMDVYYGDSCAPEKAESLKTTLVENMGLKFKKRGQVGPIIGTHGGPGCVGIAYFEKAAEAPTT